MKIKDIDIENLLSFSETKKDLVYYTKSINKMNPDEYNTKQDINSFICILNIKIERVETLLNLLKFYSVGIEKGTLI